MRNIFALISVAFVLYIFTFYMDGEMGVIIGAFILMAFLFSLASAKYGSKRIKVSFDCDAYVRKGSELEIDVAVEKEGTFPLAFVEIQIGVSETFEQNDNIYRLSMVTENRTDFKIKIPSVIGGNGSVYIKSVRSCGFLGFVKFNIKDNIPDSKIVGVIPEIPDISASSGLFRSVADAVMTSDDDEENDTVMMFSANTSPGYEHREYIAGDSLKRINWKLSSKTNKLMVRLDEAASVVQPCILLDLNRNSGEDIISSLKREERLLRSVFGLLECLIKQGIACTFLYRSADGGIAVENADNPDCVPQILLKVLSVAVANDSRIDTAGLTENACACILAVSHITDSYAGSTASRENTCAIVPCAEDVPAVHIPVWYMDDDNNFRQVKS